MIWRILWVAVPTAIAFLAGICIGKMSRDSSETEQKKDGKQESGGQREKSRNPTHSHARKDRHRETGDIVWSVGSPVSGEVEVRQEGEHPTVVIEPREDKLYAPVGGKITRIYPMGNEFLFCTEFGAELHIQAGEIKDELQGSYYRPRIVQNEIVGKGKLLLEFDKNALTEEGSPPKVFVSVLSSAYGSEVSLTAGDRVKTGEEILQFQEHCSHDGNYRD